MKKRIIVSVFLFVLGFSVLDANAQPIPGNTGGHGTQGNQPGGAPLDGGLFLILLMAAGYGGRYLYAAREKSKEESL